ncbi:MAG TPA: hypothetical protein VMJ65_24795 [Solirubrobacteraceae bacterium]|nr:hypothetical protein [Solirubrobacteraceae bacterium]
MPVPVEVAPFGVAPPPVAEVPPPVLPPPVPPPLVPPALVPPPVVLPPLVPPDDELEAPDDADEDGEELLEDAVDVVDFVVEALVVPVDAGAAIVAVGTVRGGAPDVSVAAEPLPHAVMPAATAAPAASAVSVRVALRAVGRRDTTGTSDLFERLHTPAAVGAVVEVLLAMLVAPVAEAKVIDCPRQLGRGRRQREQFPDDL